MKNILQVDNLTVRFRTDNGIVHAVNGISYSLKKGETLAIVGESGSGKSVQALSILRLLREPPARVSGSIYYMGRDLMTLNHDQLRQIRGKDIAMVFQDPMSSLTPVLPIGHQISETIQTHLGVNKTGARKRALELLELVGIPQPAERIDNFPHQFSGGMRQRVMIAMALSCNPQILIADEPTTALDVTIQAQIIDLVKHLRDEFGMAIIWISHDLSIVAELAERVLVMYAGSILENATVEELYRNPSHPYTLGLLKSLPRLENNVPIKLTPIEGSPPDLLTRSRGCPFAPRCAYAIERCLQEKPGLEIVAPEHEIACWVDVKLGEPR